jgi:hypothetical protein
MDTQKTFVERRRAAHAAGTLDISKDPLVQAAMDARRDSVEIMARWHERRQAKPTTDNTPVVNRRIMSRRQAE